MAYKHGIRIQENPTNVAAPVMLENGVPVIFGTAPVNLAANPKAATNQLFLCKTFAEAVQNLGYSDDYESYTLCQAMDAFFKAFGVGPVVLCIQIIPFISTMMASWYSLCLQVKQIRLGSLVKNWIRRR